MALERCSVLEEELGATHKEVSLGSVMGLDMGLILVTYVYKYKTVIRHCKLLSSTCWGHWTVSALSLSQVSLPLQMTDGF